MPLVKCPTCHRRQIAPSALMGLHVNCEECGAGFRAAEDRPKPPAAEKADPIGAATVVFASVGLIVTLLAVVGGGFAAVLWFKGPKPNPTPVATKTERPASPTPTSAVPPPAGVYPPQGPKNPRPAELGSPPPFRFTPNGPGLDGRIENENDRDQVARNTDPLAGIGEGLKTSAKVGKTNGDGSAAVGGPSVPTDADGFAKPRDDVRSSALAQRLKSKDPKERLAAAVAMGQLGDVGENARSLCNATGDPVPAVVVAALESLEKVRPDLHRPVSILALEQPLSRHVLAVTQLGGMGPRAAPTGTLILRYLHTVFPLAERAIRDDYVKVGSEEFVTREVCGFFWTGVAAIQQTGTSDAEFGDVLERITRATNWPSEDRNNALQAFGSWCHGNPNRTKRLLALLQVCLTDNAVLLTAIDTTRQLGPTAKPFAQTLRRLKFSPSETVRMAASQALDAVNAEP